jgi:hypothetical protein
VDRRRYRSFSCALEFFMLVADPLFYAVAIPAVLLTGISKGASAARWAASACR